MIAQNLKLFRDALGLTQAQIAKTLGLKQPVYQRYESGAHKIPFETVLDLKYCFGISVDWLITGEGIMFDKPIPGLAERLREFQKALNSNSETISFTIGVDEKEWNGYIEGNRTPPLQVMHSLHMKLMADLNFLLSGTSHPIYGFKGSQTPDEVYKMLRDQLGITDIEKAKELIACMRFISDTAFFMTNRR